MKIFPRILAGLSAIVLIQQAAPAVVISSDTLLDVGNTAYDGLDLVVSNCTLTLNGAHSFLSLRLTNSAVVTHSPAPAGEPQHQLNLLVTQGVTVDGSSRVDVSARGYAAASGPGAGTSSALQAGSGGGHGGIGGLGGSGASGGSSYGSILLPATHGSGGGSGYLSLGGNGGGVVRITLGGTLRVDGIVTARGGHGSLYNYGAGGSGGSIALTASNLIGFGSITANGGTATGGFGGGGAGGRILVEIVTNQFAGVLAAFGGSGQQPGGAGTVLLHSLGSPGEIRVDNNGIIGGFTPLSATPQAGMVIANRAVVIPQSDLTNYSITIKSNGLLTQTVGSPGLNITVVSDLVIEPGGRLDVSGLGFAAGSGPGAGVLSTNGGGGGAGHGGVGGAAAAAGGGPYGSIVAPSLAGSGGGAGYFSRGGAGGGVLRLNVGGMVQVDGLLSARGADSSDYNFGGGGAGGSLWLSAGTLRGNGTLTASGGDSLGNGGGGGAGGRIALYFASNSFSGTLIAAGGAGATRGGAGTIFTKSATSTHGALLISNGGQPGGLTRLNPASWPAGSYFDLTVAGAAKVNPEVPVTFWTLVLSNGATLSHDAGQAGFHVTTLGDARLDAGTAINVDARGLPSATGAGAGGSSAQKGGGGGGYGGVGGAWTNTAPAGVTYGSAEEPVDLGSGGGAGFLSRGGTGGGALRLTVGGLLQLNGKLTANGGAGLDGTYGAGGSGGSIYLSADILTGTGSLSANGGASVSGGGGGGGRIALYPRLLVGFSNAPSVLGGLSGTGSNTNLNGRPGTVYYASNVAPLRVLSTVPAGTLTQPFASVDLLFSAAVNPGTFTPADVVITTPAGVIPTLQIVITPLAGPLFNLGFPVQTNVGSYQLQVGPHFTDLAGRELDQNGNRVPGEVPGDVFVANFTLQRPTVAGTVTAANGWPVRGVTVRAADHAATTTTDTNGLYTLTLPVGWSGSILPSLAGASFTPSVRTYPMLSENLTGQNFTLDNDLSPSLSVSLVGTNAHVTWNSLSPYKYQLKASQDLQAWANLGPATPGNGAVLSVDVPLDPARPWRFFRVQVLLN